MHQKTRHLDSEDHNDYNLKHLISRRIHLAHAGFDSLLLKRSTSGADARGEGVFRALLGASVTVSDEDVFKEVYYHLIDETLAAFKIPRKKSIYKGAHLLQQAKDRGLRAISMLINKLEPHIEHIDVYCAYYARPYISMYGQSTLRRLLPSSFIEKTQNAFPHICAWWYLQRYGSNEPDTVMQIDHFQGEVTPAWRELTENHDEIEVFYSGDECNHLISTADLILKLIEVFQHGNVDGRSLLQPIRNRCESYIGKKKLWFQNLGGSGYLLKASVPDIPMDIDITPYLKHPIIFIGENLGSPKIPKKNLEWSPIYDAVIAKAIEEKGGVKFVRFEEDVLIWDAKKDYFFPLSEDDKRKIQELAKTGHKVPKLLLRENLIKA